MRHFQTEGIVFLERSYHFLQRSFAQEFASEESSFPLEHVFYCGVKRATAKTYGNVEAVNIEELSVIHSIAGHTIFHDWVLCIIAGIFHIQWFKYTLSKKFAVAFPTDFFDDSA